MSAAVPASPAVPSTSCAGRSAQRPAPRSSMSVRARASSRVSWSRAAPGSSRSSRWPRCARSCTRRSRRRSPSRASRSVSPLRDDAADGIVVAQAFHWFDARTRPGGVPARPAPERRAGARVERPRRRACPGSRAISELIEPLRGDDAQPPRRRRGAPRSPPRGPSTTPVEHTFPNDQSVTPRDRGRPAPVDQLRRRHSLRPSGTAWPRRSAGSWRRTRRPAGASGSTSPSGRWSRSTYLASATTA